MSQPLPEVVYYVLDGETPPSTSGDSASASNPLTPTTTATWLHPEVSKTLHRLCRKALKDWHPTTPQPVLQILCGSAEMLAALDTALWEADPTGFLPHGETRTDPIRLLVSLEATVLGSPLLNLSGKSIAHWPGKILEIVAPTHESKQLGRAHFAEYSAAGRKPLVYPVKRS